MTLPLCGATAVRILPCHIRWGKNTMLTIEVNGRPVLDALHGSLCIKGIG